MRKISLCSVLIILFTTADFYSQKAVYQDNYTSQVQKEIGDLNKDKQDDKVMVEMDPEDKARPIRLQIFLSQPGKKLQMVVSSTKIMESQYPANKNGEHNGNPVPDFFIEDGNLKMLTDINNRKSTYEFTLKQNNFELTKISRVFWDGKNKTFETDIDLIAKTKIEFEQELGSDEILHKRKKDIKISLLPKIQDLSFSDLEKY
nr:hypothetical protein [uncultured Chryseobacterium sp.]